MRKPRRLIVPLIVLVAIALVLYFEPTRCVHGWLWGEAFFDGRPTSHWHSVVERELESDFDVLVGVAPPPLPSWWRRFGAWMGFQPRRDLVLHLLQSEEADPVIAELTESRVTEVAAFARDLQAATKCRGSRNEEHIAWLRLIVIHHRDQQKANAFLR